MIISASRRTDIPSYYSEWFINRLKEGYALTRNPMNHAQISKIELSPKVIDCIVFWTKDPLPMMDKLSILDDMGYPYYFQFTLTPYGKELEQNLRDKLDIIDTFRQLSKRIGKEKVLWRYDPIILNEYYDITYHREKFDALCGSLQEYTEICTISFVDLYTKLNNTNRYRYNSCDPMGDSRRVQSAKKIREIAEPEMHSVANLFSEIGKKYGINLRACSEKIDLSSYGIKPASCIDKETVERICGYTIAAKVDQNQRSGCGCIQSIDIGIYNTCKNGCIYCYANHSQTSVENNFKRHRPDAELLIGEIQPSEQIRPREMKLLKAKQDDLYKQIKFFEQK